MFKNQNLKEVNDELEKLRFKTKVVDHTYDDVDYRFEKMFGTWRVFIREVNGWKFETYLMRSGDDESGKALFEDHMDAQLVGIIKESRKRYLHR